MQNQSIAIKFPKKDIEKMDRLIGDGEFISRSDLIREGARRLLLEEKEKYKDEFEYVQEMETSGVFEDSELILLVNLLVEKPLSARQKVIAKRLYKHPLKPLSLVKGNFELTDIGKDLAQGFVDSLLYLGKSKNAH